MKVIIAGHGKMANLFIDGLAKAGHEPISFDMALELNVANIVTKETVALHLGSGRQLVELIEECTPRRIPILNGSTGQKFPAQCGVPLVNAENFALPILRVIRALPMIHEELNPVDYSLSYSITESHQQKKNTIPGTAERMAAAIDLSPSDIVSIRDPKKQRALGILPEHLEGHAYHWITWEGAGVEIQMITKVNGHDAYYKGGQYLLRTLVDRASDMPNGVVDVIPFLRW